jgi:hypothetical protein
MQFRDIGKNINNFLDFKKYNLQRTVKFNVKTDEVNWELENKLNDKGDVVSFLEVSHKFKPETLELKTHTKKSPIFRLKSKRFEPKFRFAAILEDPSLKFKVHRTHPKYTVDVEDSYDYQSGKYSVEPAFAYSGVNKFTFGVKAKFEGTRDAPAFNPTDYNIAVQYDHNEDQSFVVSTKNKATVITTSARVRVRGDWVGYARVSFDRAAGAEEVKDSAGDSTAAPANPLAFQVGISRKLSDNASLAAVYRSNGKASAMYNCKFPDSKVSAKVGANFTIGQNPIAADMVYKVVFG